MKYRSSCYYIKKQSRQNETRIKKQWITNEIVRKMEEQGWNKTINNALQRETDEAKKKYIDSVYNKIMDLQRRGRYEFFFTILPLKTPHMTLWIFWFWFCLLNSWAWVHICGTSHSVMSMVWTCNIMSCEGTYSFRWDSNHQSIDIYFT